MSGPPCQDSTGLAGDTGLSHVWGTTVPACASSGGAWSLQMTGLIDLPTTGTWTFQLASQSALAVSLNGSPLGQATGYGTWGTPAIETLDVTNPGWQQIAIDYVPIENPTGTQSNGFSVSYQAPGGALAVVPYSAIDPGYGLKTSTVDPDGMVTITRYADPTGGIDPIDGLTTQTVKDPSSAMVAADGLPPSLGDASGLSLTTTTNYEPPGPGAYFRKTATILPAGGATTYSYYSGTQGPIAAVCGVSATTPQGGRLEQQTDPAPSASAATSARTQEFVYNEQGQQVGVRVSNVKSIASAPWQCTSYDGQGSLSTQTWPALGTKLARTVLYSYAVGGDPLVNSVNDTTGTITATVDLEGRVVSYTDASGQTTSTTYDQAGQEIQTSSTVNGIITTIYDPNSGQPTLVAPATLPAAEATYYPATAGVNAGQLSTVNFGNGVEASYTYNDYGAESGVSYANSTTGAPIASENVQFTLAGRELTDGYNGATSSNPNGGPDFTYDAAGRLTLAYVPGEEVYNNYGSIGCAQPNLGLDTNVSETITVPTSGSATAVQSCYNGSDRLTGTTTIDLGTGTSTPSTAYSYDALGNQLKDGPNTYTWDSSGRVATVNSASGKETYTFDALDRLIKKVVGTTKVRYAYCGLASSPCGTISTTGAVVSGYVTLLGGVMLTVVAGSGSSDEWSLPDVHGDFMMTTSQAGTPSGLATYTPYGAPAVGSSGALANSGNAGSTLGAFGTAGKVTDTVPVDPVVLLGARLYNPTEGRFLSVDPIEGGCANAYVYVRGDPLSHEDLSGMGGCQSNDGFSASCDVWSLSCAASFGNDILQSVAGDITSAEGGAIAGAIGTIVGAAICAPLNGIVILGTAMDGACAVAFGALFGAAMNTFITQLQFAASNGESLVISISLESDLTYQFVAPRGCT